MSNSNPAFSSVQCQSVESLTQIPLYFAPMEDMAPEEPPFLLSDMKTFLEAGYYFCTSDGERRPNWADDIVMIDFTLVNSLVTRENVENFYKSCVGQMGSRGSLGSRTL